MFTWGFACKPTSLTPALRGNSRPAGFPHAHPRISNILGHGSKLMAISLLAIWLVPWPKPRLGLRPRQWPQAQGHGHGPGRKLVARKGSGPWHQTQGNVPKPQAMAKAPGHGHGSGPKLMAREGSGYRVWDVGYLRGMGYRVLGGGYWVSGIGDFHFLQHARRQMGRRIIW